MRRKSSGRGRNSGDWETIQNLWGGSTYPAFALAPGNAVLQLVAGIVPAVAPIGTVPLGRMLITEIDFVVDIPMVNSSSGLVNYGVGLYPGEWSTSTTAWSTQSPLIVSDACRDNWLTLDVGCAWVSSSPTLTQHGIRIKHNVKCNLSLTQGQGVLLTIQNDATSGVPFNWQAFTRYKVRRVM
jgi:hypothetical protein